jgi:DnaJ-class molecular chaperone with C-terminal Zn finger domain
MSANSAINHYTVLGVARDSTSKEIRSAYKKLALKLHPDKAGNSPEATERFRKVSGCTLIPHCWVIFENARENTN